MREVQSPDGRVWRVRRRWLSSSRRRAIARILFGRPWRIEARTIGAPYRTREMHAKGWPREEGSDPFGVAVSIARWAGAIDPGSFEFDEPTEAGVERRRRLTG